MRSEDTVNAPVRSGCGMGMVSLTAGRHFGWGSAAAEPLRHRNLSLAGGMRVVQQVGFKGQAQAGQEQLTCALEKQYSSGCGWLGAGA